MITYTVLYGHPYISANVKMGTRISNCTPPICVGVITYPGPRYNVDLANLSHYNMLPVAFGIICFSFDNKPTLFSHKLYESFTMRDLLVCR